MMFIFVASVSDRRPWTLNAHRRSGSAATAISTGHSNGYEHLYKGHRNLPGQYAPRVPIPYRLGLNMTFCLARPVPSEDSCTTNQWSEWGRTSAVLSPPLFTLASAYQVGSLLPPHGIAWRFG
jgi:hypothetical protein